VDRFIHPDYRQRVDIRYIKKTIDTQLTWEEMSQLVDEVRRRSMITMATPFDEVSVDKCVEYGVQIIKLASSDVKDWLLIERIAQTRKPVIMSTGGSNLRDIDDIVSFFNKRNVPLAINHCVSIYPSEDGELQLNQIDFLARRYPENVIGFSTHEYRDWRTSMAIAYAKGARTFERHIDIEEDDIPVSPYCSLPTQVDEWFKAFLKAQEMCGAPGVARRVPPEKEVRYLDALVRGVYAKYDLPAGARLSAENVFLAIPLLKGQMSCRELMNDEVLMTGVEAGKPVMFDSLDSPYAHDTELAVMIRARGYDP
jgi:sialic acid synthase SpsE